MTEQATAEQMTIDHPQSGEGGSNLAPMSREDHSRSLDRGRSDVVSANPMELLDKAISSGAGIETLERLMGLQERWEANQARRAFDAAVAEAKAKIPPIIKNREVDFTSNKGRTHYKHEDLAEIARTVDPILAAHGLSYRFRPTQTEARSVSVTCVLSHRDGYSEESTLSADRDESGNKNSIQAVGSTVTYLQRYTLKMALGLAASNDDDGKTAGIGGPVNAQQLKAIRDLIKETGVDEAKVADYAGVKGLDEDTPPALEDIPANEFDRVMRALKVKRRNATASTNKGGPDGVDRKDTDTQPKGEGESLPPTQANSRTASPSDNRHETQEGPESNSVSDDRADGSPSPLRRSSGASPSRPDSPQAKSASSQRSGGESALTSKNGPDGSASGEPSDASKSFLGADADMIRNLLNALLSAADPKETFDTFMANAGDPRGRKGEALKQVSGLHARFYEDEITRDDLTAKVEQIIAGGGE